MNYGRYFELDLMASKVEEGISVFNYIDLPDAAVDTSRQKSPQYPIFVTFTPQSVKFILQYCVVYKYNGKILLDTQKCFQESSAGLSVVHMEEVILELPLRMTGGQSLSSIVKRIYSTPFPISLKNDVNYIEELILSRYITNRRFHNEIKQHAILRERDKGILSYSSLYVWDLYNEESGKFELFNWDKCNKFLRKIFLDFLYDMMHSDVFKNSVYYDTVYGALMGDYFCSAIIKKSEFYYQRSVVNERLKSESKNKNADEIYAAYFDKAEMEWVDCIQDQHSDKQFESVYSWYKKISVTDKDSSTDNIIEKWWCIVIDSLYEFIWPRFNIREKNWFASPEKELQRVYFLKLGKKPVDERVCDVKCYSDELGIRGLEDIYKRRRKSSLWFFKRYDFSDSYRLSYIPCFNGILFAFLFIVTILLLCGDKIVIKAASLLNSINSGWCVITGILFVIYCGIRHFWLKVPFHIHFLFPRLVASITAAWLTVALSEDLYKAFFDSQWSLFPVVIIMGLILLFVYYEVNKIVPQVGYFVKLFRSTQLLLTSFVISVFVGIIVINFTGERMLVRSGILPEFYRDYVLVEHEEYDDNLAIDFKSIDTVKLVELINKYTYLEGTSGELSLTEQEELVQAKAFMEIFANTEYEKEYLERIRMARTFMDTYPDVALPDSLLLGKFLVRHENSRMFKDLLEFVKHKEDNHRVATFITVGDSGYRFFILYDFLIQFAVVAMFIGIFIQMIFEEKNVTEV